MEKIQNNLKPGLPKIGYKIRINQKECFYGRLIGYDFKFDGRIGLVFRKVGEYHEFRETGEHSDYSLSSEGIGFNGKLEDCPSALRKRILNLQVASFRKEMEVEYEQEENENEPITKMFSFFPWKRKGFLDSGHIYNTVRFDGEVSQRWWGGTYSPYDFSRIYQVRPFRTKDEVRRIMKSFKTLEEMRNWLIKDLRKRIPLIDKKESWHRT
jgi:hypothetical protein